MDPLSSPPHLRSYRGYSQTARPEAPLIRGSSKLQDTCSRSSKGEMTECGSNGKSFLWMCSGETRMRGNLRSV